MPQIVWFFDKPTIGYCRECEVIAIYLSHHGGLVCPDDMKHQLSIFEWDEFSPHPEDDVGEDED